MCWNGTKTGQDMFGVVLWSDEQDQNAVIWCEDHGDLAFYRNDTNINEVEMDAGDWVQFDMKMDQNQRKAHNPRLVSEGVYPDLADALCAAPSEKKMGPSRAESHGSECRTAPADRNSAQIIPLFPGQSPGQSAETRASNAAHMQTA